MRVTTRGRRTKQEKRKMMFFKLIPEKVIYYCAGNVFNDRTLERNKPKATIVVEKHIVYSVFAPTHCCVCETNGREQTKKYGVQLASVIQVCTALVRFSHTTAHTLLPLIIPLYIFVLHSILRAPLKKRRHNTQNKYAYKVHYCCVYEYSKRKHSTCNTCAAILRLLKKKTFNTTNHTYKQQMNTIILLNIYKMQSSSIALAYPVSRSPLKDRPCLTTGNWVGLTEFFLVIGNLVLVSASCFSSSAMP